MVWASQEPVDDSTPGIDCVRAKPLKKRCSTRPGLSRYYSSKSQSFSSLDLVQCTPFGTSALALAKRPSSFDLRRSSPRAGLGLSRAASSCLRKGCERETGMSVANEEEEEEERDLPDRCPCNDTIFADPSEAFMSPEGSPRASTLEMYGSGSLSGPGGVGAHHQQRHYQLTTDYLTHLSAAFLPLQPSFFANGSSGALGSDGACGPSGSIRGGGLTTALSGSCCSGSSKSLSSGSSSSSSSASTSSYVDSSIALKSTGAPVNRTWPQFAGSGREAVTQTLLLQSCSEDVRSAGIGLAGSGRAVNCGGGGAIHPFASQNSVGSANSGVAATISRPRNCLSAGGYLCPMLHAGGTTAATVTEPSCAGGVGGVNGNGNGNSGVPALGRKLGLGIAHRRLRAAQAAGIVAVHSARQAAAGFWGSTEDMIASLTLSDRQPSQNSSPSSPPPLQQHHHHHASLSRVPVPGSASPGGDGNSWFGSSGPRWQQQSQQSQSLQHQHQHQHQHHQPAEPWAGGSYPFGIGREVHVHSSTSVVPGVITTAPVAAARAPSSVLDSARACDSSRVGTGSFSESAGRHFPQHLQHLQQQEHLLCCSSAPPAPVSFGRFNGGSRC